MIDKFYEVERLFKSKEVVLQYKTKKAWKYAFSRALKEVISQMTVDEYDYIKQDLESMFNVPLQTFSIRGGK